MASTVKKGYLRYRDTDGLLTTVVWHNIPKGHTGAVITKEFCGSEDPVTVKWAGDRYTATAPSSASVVVLISDLQDRQFLEDIFNGGYTLQIRKEYTPGHANVLFWEGKVEPILSADSYKWYPYFITINANDGIKRANDRQFLMIDFPEPWPVGKVSVLDLLIKYIDLNLTPNDTFRLNVSSRIHNSSFWTALEFIYLDPRVFMEDGEDTYIKFEDLLKSLLGPLHLQLFQWFGEWWVVSLDAQWDNAKTYYTQYDVDGGSWTTVGYEILDPGILDLYADGKTALDRDREVNNSAYIDFIRPWIGVDIKQDFQINNNIIEVYANRLGNFYHGHQENPGEPFYPLEFKQAISFTPGNLRHWDSHGLTAFTFGNKFNSGNLWVNISDSTLPRDKYVETSHTVNPNLRFDKFRFTVNSVPTYKMNANALDGEFTPKRVFKITYTDTTGHKWWFWRNETEPNGPFDGWDDSTDHHYVFDYAQVNVEAFMPDGNAFTGGTFTLGIYEAYDQHAYGLDYGMLYSNVTLGVASTIFDNKFIWESGKDRVKNNRLKWATLTAVLLAGDPVIQTNIISNSIGFYDAKWHKNRYAAAGPPTVEPLGKATDFNWEDTIKLDINPNGGEKLKEEYKWGLHVDGVDSFHDLHLSSAYDYYNEVITNFSKHGETATKPLLNWKAESWVRDNSQYTTVLSGTYLSDKIAPFQLISDYEGRVYKFTNGTWHDKKGYWACSFTEFKALNTAADFSALDFNNDFDI